MLRKVGKYYIHIGLCFVVGIMDGEAMEDLTENDLAHFVIV
jgi:hypothetical protein